MLLEPIKILERQKAICEKKIKYCLLHMDLNQKVIDKHPHDEDIKIRHKGMHDRLEGQCSAYIAIQTDTQILIDLISE